MVIVGACVHPHDVEVTAHMPNGQTLSAINYYNIK